MVGLGYLDYSMKSRKYGTRMWNAARAAWVGIVSEI